MRNYKFTTRENLNQLHFPILSVRSKKALQDLATLSPYQKWY